MPVDTQPRDVAGSVRGRPRPQRSRVAALCAMRELLDEVGLRWVTTDEIATRSGVSKATIYEW